MGSKYLYIYLFFLFSTTLVFTFLLRYAIKNNLKE